MKTLITALREHAEVLTAEMCKSNANVVPHMHTRWLLIAAANAIENQHYLKELRDACETSKDVE